MQKPQPKSETVKPMVPPGGKKSREYTDERGDEDWTAKDLAKLSREGYPKKSA
jgi:hypothetical protein